MILSGEKLLKGSFFFLPIDEIEETIYDIERTFDLVLYRRILCREKTERN